LSAGLVGPAREPEPEPNGSDTEGTEKAGAAGGKLSLGEGPERGAKAARGVEDESAVAADPEGESGMVVP